MIYIMRIIGITGSSGAGKSTLSEIISNMYDTYVINADELAKEIASQQEGKQYGARGLKRLAKKMLISKIKETEANKIKSKSV